MIRQWQRMTRQQLTQSFAYGSEITFPPLADSDGTEGPLVIEAEIDGHMIHHIYIGGGSSTEILYEHGFNQLCPEIRSQMVPARTSLTGFSGETIWPLGQLRLLVTIGDADHSTKAWMDFMSVRSILPYNGIIGRPGIREIQAMPSTAYRMLKFPADGGIVTIRSTILIHSECVTLITSPKEIPKEAGTSHQNLKEAILLNFPDQKVAIGGTLSLAGCTELCTLLKKNLDIFACQPSDMTGIPMAESDEEKMAFHTSQGVYCYTKMPFGLKNVGATYQRLVDRAFDSHVGQNMEVYVDNLVIKSHTEAEMLRDIGETFRTLRKINMKLNPKKYTFRAVEGMFLGYMITLEGIKSCPDKTEAVLQLPSPRTIKEVQSLNGKLASLNRFLSKSAEKSLPLFKTLKRCIKKSDFRWTPEAEQAFKQLKQHLSELPLLVAPKPKEELIVYLSASYGAVSAVLMTERGTVQTSVYFISRALQGPELNYTPMEKLVLSLVFAAKRLQRYFQAHPIAVITDQPIKQHHIPSKNIGERADIGGLPHGSGAGLILTSPEGTEFTYALLFQFTASNNEAEYEALIASLRIAAQMGVQNVQVNMDSKLVANQVLGTKNKKADALSKIASTSFAHLSKQVLVEVLQEKSIQEKEVTTVVEEDGPTWMTPIMEYLKDGTLPGDRKEASKLRIKARQYELMEGTLYRRSFLKSWLRCLGPLQASYVIREIHEGSCSMHAGPRSVVAKAMRLGYYWPTMHRDARDMIRACNDCQVHRPVPRNPQQPLTPITAPWLFYKWGIDIAAPWFQQVHKS
ncbi:reverse transcriptase domain-containing protein [Tanacetum coccineum]